MENRFTFDGALMHFVRTDAPGGFFWKFLLAYVLLYGLVAAILFAVVGGPFMAIMQMSMENPGRQMSDEEAMRFLGTMGLFYLVALPLFGLVWAMLEASLQRRYVRLEGFSLRVGGDELRVLAVGLLWILLVIGLYIAMVIVVAVPIGILAAASGASAGGAVVAGILGFIGIIAGILAMFFIMIRLSPAAAITIRDRKISFFRAWGATKNRFWPLLGAFFIMFLVAMLAYAVIQIIMGAALAGAMMSNAEALETGDVAAVFTSPGMLFGFAIAMLGYVVIQAGVQFVAAGIPAHAANTDPRGGGLANPAQTFD